MQLLCVRLRVASLQHFTCSSVAKVAGCSRWAVFELQQRVSPRTPGRSRGRSQRAAASRAPPSLTSAAPRAPCRLRNITLRSACEVIRTLQEDTQGETGVEVENSAGKSLGHHPQQSTLYNTNLKSVEFDNINFVSKKKQPTHDCFGFCENKQDYVPLYPERFLHALRPRSMQRYFCS